jgi:hypothetical protein
MSKLPFGDCLSKAKPYRIKMKFRSASITCLSEPCHRIASDRLKGFWGAYARLLSLPPSSIPSPLSPLWFARVTGYLRPNHRRTALGSPKTKTPQDALWSWLLARAVGRRFVKREKSQSLTTRQDHTVPCGVISLLTSSPRCHSRRFALYTLFPLFKPLRL